MVKPGLYRPTEPDEWEPPRELHPTQERLLNEMVKRQNGVFLVTVQNGLPMTITPINTEAKQKLA